MEDLAALWIYSVVKVVILTIPVSLSLLFLYRRTVSREMRKEAFDRNTSSVPSAQSTSGLAQPDKDSPNSPGATLQEGASKLVRLRLAVVYSIAGMSASAVLTALLFLSSPSTDNSWSFLQVLVTWYAKCWPIFPTLAILLVFPQKKALIVFAIYVVAGMFVAGAGRAITTAATGHIDWGHVFLNPVYFIRLLFFHFAIYAYAIILVTCNRKLRAVSAPVLASVALFAFTALACNELFVRAYDYEWVRQAGLTAFGDKGWFLVMAVPAGVLCWLILKSLGLHFVQKDFSDVQLLVDAWWFIVILLACIDLLPQMGWSALSGFLALVAYRGIVSVGLRLWPQGAYPFSGPRLLLLRVFGFQNRTEQLFDAIASRWRLVGCVTMIGGADLAMRTVSLPRLVSFLSNRLGQEFVRDDREVSAKLAQIDELRDPDGRFRIAELFCHDNSWRATLRALVKRSDIVLMDLRSFTRNNQGCVFELKQLTETNALRKTVFVVDDTTDVDLLHTTLAEAREQDAECLSSPSLLRITRRANSQAEHKRIYQALSQLAAKVG